MGIIAVSAMFVVPLYVALNGMFGSNWMKVIMGETDDHVAAAPAPTKASGGRAAKKDEG